MKPAIIKAGAIEKARGLFGVPATAESDCLRLSADGYSLRFRPGRPEILSASAKEKVDPFVVSANQLAIIGLPVPLRPARYHFAIGFNPEILKYGTLSAPGLVSHKDLAELKFGFYAVKKVNLAEDLEWLFELTAVD